MFDTCDCEYSYPEAACAVIPPKNIIPAFKPNDIIPLAPLECNPPRKKGKTMSKTFNEVTINAEASTPVEVNQREYLLGRLWNERMVQEGKIKEKFFITPDEAPKTPQEAADRLAAGKFVIKSLKDQPNKKYGWNDWYYDFEWRSQPADKAGAKASEEKMTALYQSTLDLINIKSPDEGLAAMQTFVAATF